MPFPLNRGRRLRRTTSLRRLFAEHRLSSSMMIQPLFICPGSGIERPIPSLPGQSQLSVDRATERALVLDELGLGGVILFGIPSRKDAVGSEATDPKGVVASAARAIKARCPDFIVIGDVCLCEYTDHGHCGVLGDLAGRRDVDNDATIDLLGDQAVVLAKAGCDIVAPSAMADGQVDAIRAALDESELGHVPILSYAAKYASAFYGPFRDAADNAPSFGDRRSYQMDPPNVREAMREVELDVDEGADIIMVKPALPYLDVIARVREAFDVPIAAYHVSGEFAMVHAAGERGWIDVDAALTESLVAIQRAGADLIVTYAAEWFATSFGQ